MFDIGFWELATIGVIALIVLGPERLPVVARTLGQWVGRAKGYMNTITSELEREVKTDEIRDEVRQAREQIEAETRHVHDSARDSVEPAMRPLDDEADAGPQSEDTSTAAQSAPADDSAATSEEEKPASDPYAFDVPPAADDEQGNAHARQDSGHQDR